MAAGSAVSEKWGTCQLDGKDVDIFTLTADSGAKLRVCTYGATLVSLQVPDRAGNLEDVLLGFDDLASYEQHATYIGCAVGRVCSRIAGAKFQLAGASYQLPANNGAACHHGGPVGFNQYTWEVVEVGRQSVKLRFVSPHLDQGFPGELRVLVEYSLLPVGKPEGTALSFRFWAETDRTTVVNLTNHLYFNLAGHAGSMQDTMYNHFVTIAADSFIPTDGVNIPLGEFRAVDGTPFDFRVPTKIGDRIEQNDEQLLIASGYDHNMALRETPPPPPRAGDGGEDDGGGAPPPPLPLPPPGGGIAAAAGRCGGTRLLGVDLCGGGLGGGGRWAPTREPDAVAEEPSTGRRVEMYTTEPAVHFYSGNYLGGEPLGKAGARICRRAGFCFETQHFTDSPNQPSLSCAVLEPGQVWDTQTVFWFPRPAA